jgi:hypothetical protein
MKDGIVKQIPLGVDTIGWGRVNGRIKEGDYGQYIYIFI